MVQNKGRKKLVAVLATIGVLLLIIAAVTVVKSLSISQTPKSNETDAKNTSAVDKQGDSNDSPTVEPVESTVVPTVDPTTVLTVAIEPMTISVPYIRGVDGFDFQVLRTPSGTKYVQFSSEKLVGTKCTNDQGQFASIIENLSTDEAATVAKTITVDGTSYGLSLADATCTRDSDLLKQYQNAFSEPFSLMKKM